MSNDLTIDKPAFLRERGWNTWYNENYWVRQDHHLPGIDYTSCGLNTEEAYAFETDPESKKRTLAGMELYHSAAKALSNLGLKRCEYPAEKDNA